jgi:hypothetical protein
LRASAGPRCTRSRPTFVSALRHYEALHRPCGLGTPAYARAAEPLYAPTNAIWPSSKKLLNPSLATPDNAHQASPSPTTSSPTPSKSNLLHATDEELHHVLQKCSSSKTEEEKECRQIRAPTSSSSLRKGSTFRSLLEHLQCNSIPLSPHARLVTGAAGGSLSISNPGTRATYSARVL